MITYELSKKLKDAGFPQNMELLGKLSIYGNGGRHVVDDDKYGDFENRKFISAEFMSMEYLTSEEGEKNTYYKPTLHELIEACGEKFGCLTTLNLDKKYFVAYSLEEYNKIFENLSFVKAGQDGIRYTGLTGSTPEEAVSNLWLSLNEKK